MKPRALLLAGAFVICNLLAAASAWRPITPEDLAARPPEAEPAANGLILLREISVDSRDRNGTEFEYYLRIKVFTPAGVENLNKTEIPFAREDPPRKLAARVVKPDGRTIEVAQDAIFTRDVVKTGGEAVAVKAFSFAALEPGDIAEYRYQVRKSEIVEGMRFYIDSIFPSTLVRVHIGMIDYPGLGIQSVWSRPGLFEQTSPKGDKDLVFVANRVPSTLVEPFSPPDDMVKPWFMFYYTMSDGTAQKYWSYTGGELQALADAYVTPKKRVKETAAELLTGNLGEEETINRLYEFCRTKIKNISHDGSSYTPDQIEKLKINKSSADTLNTGYGTAAQINMLFGALLRASGRHCYLAYCGDRSQNLFSPQLKTRSALPRLVVAMQTSEKWKFYDPGSRYLAPGKLEWKNEQTTALAVADKYWQFVETPSSEASYSTTHRSADFTLSPDGTLEGDIAIALEGHPGFAAKHRFGAKTASECAEMIKQDLATRLGQVEVSDAKIELPDALSSPITLRCHVRIPDYASVVGDRLILPPAFFQKGVPAAFSAAQRRHDIYFPYYARDNDEIAITFPDGYEMEPPAVARPIDNGSELHYSTRIDLSDDGRKVVFNRSFVRRLSWIPASGYPLLQREFQRIEAQDSRTISLRHSVVTR